MPTPILMPALSPTMTEGTLARWVKKEGDTIKAGEVIAEIETDKATMEVEAVDEGVLAKIIIAAGTSGVAVNAPIAYMVEDGEKFDPASLGAPANDKAAPKAAGAAAPAASAPATAPVAPASSAPAAQAVAPAASSGDRLKATPLARRLATEKGLNLASVQGTGPNGRITKADVLSGKTVSVTAAAPAPAPVMAATGAIADTLTKQGQSFTAIPNNNIKKVTARRLSESKQTVPHFYLSVDCRIDQLLAMRKRINDSADVKVSVNDFVVRAVALALKEVPAANSAWSDDAVLQFNTVDISVAVATPNGLITPIVKNADKKGLAGISSEMKDLAERARAGKLKPEEFQGGGFTISNLGMFGVKDFAAIINPPQSCILAVGAGDQRPVVVDGKIEVATVMTCTLSVDHRSVDGAVGAQFLAAFKKRIEDPAIMLL
jgi:pyruvate dehydrogenase E2 component (dihydrolipoamide acetyltransferase)